MRETVRLGAHYGSLLYRDGDYVGTTVDVAARVQGFVSRNGLLITGALRTIASPDSPDVVNVGPTALKGISGDVVHMVMRHGAPEGRVDHPVRHMSLTPESAAATARWLDTDLFFCSTDCAERFFARTGAFATSTR